MRNLTVLSAVVALSTLPAGCSPKPEPKETVVTGKVALDGEVLTMGEVVFENMDGTASGLGEIGADGTYRVPSVPLGKVRAAVRTSNYAQYAGAEKKIGGKAITMGGREGKYVPVPQKYEDPQTSGLEYDISPEATIDIVLTK